MQAQDKTTIAPYSDKKSWYETFQIQGYNQIRHNRLLETNKLLTNPSSGDKSIGDKGGVFIRRMRIIFQGNIGEHVYLYVQPDFASTVTSDNTNIYFTQLRDAYFDVGLDKHNEFRLRIGQSKVPFGFENMQSSQNCLPLDRSDALNSALSNERDLGTVFYYPPKNIRKKFASYVADGLKGKGDYGVLALGFYNGQTANKTEVNNSPHIVTRASWPFEYNGQTLELSAFGYKGMYVIDKNSTTKAIKNLNYTDDRFGGTFNLYPKPFGILAEYNVGTGPEFNKVSDSVENQRLHSGFVTFSYKTDIKGKTIIPFYRTQYYKGGKKHEKDAASYIVTENEIGVEYQATKNFELTVKCTLISSRIEDFTKQNNLQNGNLLHIQAQINF